MGSIRVDKGGRLMACFSDPVLKPVDLGGKLTNAIRQLDKCLQHRIVDVGVAAPAEHGCDSVEPSLDFDGVHAS